MSANSWMQILVVTVIAAFASKTTHAVLCRVRAQNPTRAAPDWAEIGSPSGPVNRHAERELAVLFGVDPSRVDLTLTEDHEVHCSIRADPAELLELSKAAGSAIDQAFRERQRWTDLRVILHLEARPRTNGSQGSDT